MIADGSRVWRQAVCSILQQHLDSVVICESSDGLEAVRKSEELQPDLVLLDIVLSNLDGLEAARQIRKLAPGSRILFLSSYDWPELLDQAISIGAMGLVAKSEAAHDLLPAVSAVLRDEQYFGRGFSPLDPTKPPYN